MEIGIRADRDLIGLRLVSAGYPRDKDASRLWADSACRLRRTDPPGRPGAFLTDCAAVPGDSGEPLAEASTGHPEVVAMAEGGLGTLADLYTVLPAYRPDRASIAVDIRGIYRRIASLVGRDRARFGRPNRALR